MVKLYIEDYVNTYLKRLYPTGGQDLRVGLLLGEIRTEDGIPFLFIDGAMEMEQVTRDGGEGGIYRGGLEESLSGYGADVSGTAVCRDGFCAVRLAVR